MSDDLIAKYGLQTAAASQSMGLAETAVHGAVATIADFGTSVWNSLPMTEEVSTSELLSKIDSDALSVYNENPELIHAASFIAGSFVPIGLSMKAMNLARNGSKAVNWFSKAGEVSRLKKVESAFAEAGIQSETYKMAKNSVYRAMAGNAMADSLAAELAIVSTMNAHPYMEDYNKDFASNFAFWTLAGGGIGAGIGAIIQRTALKSLTHGIEAKALTETLERGGLPLPNEVASFADQIPIRTKYADYLEGKIARANDPNFPDYNLNPLTIKMLTVTAERERALAATIATDKLMTGKLAEAEASVIKIQTDRLATDARFTGTDRMSWFQGTDFAGIKGELKEAPTLFETVTRKIKGEEVTKEIFPKAVFHPKYNAFTSLAEASHLTDLTAIASTLDDVVKTGKRININHVNQDQFLELSHIPTHRADLIYAATLVRVNELSVKDLAKHTVAATDLPMRQAVAAKLNTLSPMEAAQINITVVAGKESKKLNVLDFIKETEVATLSTIRDYLKQGMAAETVALRSGASRDAVRAIQQGTKSEASLIKYTSIDDINKALDPANKALVIQANPRKVMNDRTLKAELNIQTMDNASQELINFFMATSESELVKNIHSFYGTEEFKALSSMLYNSVGEVTSAGLGNVFTRSLNSALESFKEAGVIATRLGQSNITIRNRMTEKFITPIAELGGKVLKSQASTVEHNTAVNLNASLKGWRTFDSATGQIMQKEKQEVIKLVNGKEVKSIEEILVPAKLNGKDFRITDPDVLALFTKYQEAGLEMYHLRNLKNRVTGNNSITDLGFWIPAFNPREKQIAYVFDSRNQAITLLHAKTVAELNDAVLSYERKLKAEGLVGQVRVVTKGKEQEFFNKLAGRHDDMYMAIADVSLQHGGSSAAAIVKTNSEPLSEIINGLDHYLGKGIDEVVELNMAPVMDSLKLISDFSQRGYSKGTLGVVGQMLKKPMDPGQVMRNAILGKPNLGEFEAWRSWQQSGQVATDYALNSISSIFSPILQPVKGKIFGKEAIRNEETFKALNSELIARDLVPLQGVDDFARYMKEGSVITENLSPRIVALSNGIAATMLLRFMELAQPFVNIVSLPILTSGAMRRDLSSSFMGGVLDPNAKFKLVETMFNGIRLMNHPIQGPYWAKLANEKNLFKPIVSEANAVMHHVRSVEGGVTSKMEGLLESKFFEIASKPADYSETLVRKAAFFTGVGMAKKAYPGLDDIGVMTFARNFMDEAIGNYTAAQRPVFFQGTFGVAMGLFQTYMLTFAQNTYRQIGTKDWKGLSRTMAAQSGVFGVSSLPGFHIVSEAIGNTFSDNHYDLETGTFRSIGDEASNMALYGLLSSFGPGIYTRGDIQPRIPTPVTMDTIATVNLAKQSYTAAERLVTAAFTADADMGRAMLEALSLQSLSRPMARLSELATGTAITGAGKVVAQDAEIYSTQGILSRLMATRPLEEIKTRNALQRDSVYGAIDSDRRREVTKVLKTHIRSGDLDSSKIQELQYEYLRFGSAQGWRGAVADAMLESTRPGAKSVKDRLSPDAPWQLMVDDSGL